MTGEPVPTSSRSPLSASSDQNSFHCVRLWSGLLTATAVLSSAPPPAMIPLPSCEPRSLPALFQLRLLVAPPSHQENKQRTPGVPATRPAAQLREVVLVIEKEGAGWVWGWEQKQRGEVKRGMASRGGGEGAGHRKDGRAQSRSRSPALAAGGVRLIRALQQSCCVTLGCLLLLSGPHSPGNVPSLREGASAPSSPGSLPGPGLCT